MGATAMNPLEPFGGGGGIDNPLSPTSPAAPATTGSDPLLGMTSTGIRIPQGDPASISEAASQAKALASLWETQTSSVRGGTMTALDGWTGTAADSFRNCAASVIKALSNNQSAVSDAADAMEQLAGELATAQRMCQALASEAEDQQRAQQAAQQQAQTHEQNLANLRDQQNAGAGAMSPSAKAHLESQIQSESGAQQDASAAASRAGGDLASTVRQANRIYSEYMSAAEGLNGKIQGAADRLVGVPLPAGGAPSPITITKAERAQAIALLTKISNQSPDGGSEAQLRRANGGKPVSPQTAAALITLADGVQRPPHMGWWSSFDDGLQEDQNGPRNGAHFLGETLGILGFFAGDGGDGGDPGAGGDGEGDPEGGGDRDRGAGGVEGGLTYGEKERVAQFKDGLRTDTPPGVDRGDGRDVKGQFTGQGDSSVGGYAKDREQAGLDRYAAQNHVYVERQQVVARVDGVPGTRLYDGLVRNPDGTYTGIEVKTEGEGRTANQKRIDGAVRAGEPAHATLNGEPIVITRVVDVSMPR